MGAKEVPTKTATNILDDIAGPPKLKAPKEETKKAPTAAPI